MDSKRALTFLTRRTATDAALGGLFACALVLTSALAVAQGTATNPPDKDPGFFATIGRWFDRQAAGFNSAVDTVRDKFKDIGREAGVAAKTTVDSAKNAADAVGRLPGTRVITGHEKCQIAANGAPDCVAAASAIWSHLAFSGLEACPLTQLNSTL